MGVPGLWSHLTQAGTSHNLETLHLRALVDVLPSEHRLPIIGVDISAWLFHARLSVEGSNPILRLIFFRLARLLSLPLNAVFVFDGPLRPRVKRGRTVGAKKHPLTGPLMEMIATFGAIGWEAPGEAEAELARMNSQGLIDAVLSDDVDALIFGASTVMRNWSHTLSQARPASSEEGGDNLATIYRASNIRELPDLVLDRDGLILVALMAGGDYDVGGLGGCGVKTAIGLAQGGHGQTLLNGFRNHCKIVGHDPETKLPSVQSSSFWPSFLKRWLSEVCEELQTNKQGFLNGRSPKLAQSEAFRSFLCTQESLEVLGSYISPVTTWSLAEREGASTSSAPQPSRNRKLKFRNPDLPAMSCFAQRTFAWGPRATVARLRNVVWKGILLQELRRGRVVQWTSPNDIASQSSEDNQPDRHSKETEEVAVLKIHGERRHAETGHLLEYRVEWDPTPLAMSAEEGIDPLLNVGPGFDEDFPEEVPAYSGNSSARSTDAEDTEEELPPCSPYGLTLAAFDGCPPSPTKRKARSLPDPYSTVRTWILADRLEANEVGKALIEEYRRHLLNKVKRKDCKKSTGATRKSNLSAAPKKRPAASNCVPIDSIFTSRKGSAPICTQRVAKDGERSIVASNLSSETHVSQSQTSASSEAEPPGLSQAPHSAIVPTGMAKKLTSRTFGRTQSGPAVLSQPLSKAAPVNTLMLLTESRPDADDDEDEDVTFVANRRDDARDATLTRISEKPNGIKKRDTRKTFAALASSDTEQVLADEHDTSLPDAMDFLRTIGQRKAGDTNSGSGLEGSPSPQRSHVKRAKAGRGMREGSPPQAKVAAGGKKGNPAVSRSETSRHILLPRPAPVSRIYTRVGGEEDPPESQAIHLEDDGDDDGFELTDYRQRILPPRPAATMLPSTQCRNSTSATRFHASTLNKAPPRLGKGRRGARKSDAIVLSDSDSE